MRNIKDIQIIMLTNKKQVFITFAVGLCLLLCGILYVNYRPGFIKVKGTPAQIAELKAEMNEGFYKIFAWQDKQDSINKVTRINLQHLPTVFPVKSANLSNISSKYGIRVNPITGDTVWHKGIDIKAKIGTPVFASASGVVIESQYTSGYGNLIEINSQNGIETKFGHLLNMYVSSADTVTQGDLIGTVGMTGMTTGPHLHYEIINGNRNLNPIIFYL
jgi:murein DD-endopeptidase MepM/ murein hydrolase activator NlpD